MIAIDSDFIRRLRFTEHISKNQLQQLVAGAAQVGPQAAGAAQLGAHDVPQVVVEQHRGLQRRIFGMQSFGMQIFGILNEWQRGAQVLQLEATGAHVETGPQVETGAQLATGAAQVGAQAGAQLAAGAAQVGAQAGAQAAAGAAQVGVAATQAAGAAQLGTELQLLQLLWWNRPAWALFRLAKAASAAEIQTNFIAFSRYVMGRGNGLN